MATMMAAKPDKPSRILVLIGSLLAAIGVGIGALGSHSLPGYLEKKGFDKDKIEKRLEQCETGVKYQLFHSLAVIVVGLSSLKGRGSKIAAGLMVIGIFLFSGGIYGIVFAEAKTHGLVPFGGVAFILGWLVLAFFGWQNRPVEA